MKVSTLIILALAYKAVHDQRATKPKQQSWTLTNFILKFFNGNNTATEQWSWATLSWNEKNGKEYQGQWIANEIIQKLRKMLFRSKKKKNNEEEKENGESL